MASGTNIDEAIETANLAAAVVVGKVGSADAAWSEIEALKSTKIGLERKIVDLPTLLGLYLKDKKVFLQMVVLIFCMWGIFRICKKQKSLAIF